MKKNKILYKITLLLFVVVMGGCAPKEEQFLTRFDKFVTNVYAEKDQMTEAEWNDAILKYEKYMDEYSSNYSSKFTPEENREFGRLQALYTKALMKYAMEVSGESIEVGSQILDGYLDEMGSGLDEMGIDDYVNRVYEDIEEMDIEDFVEDVEDEFNQMEFDF